MKLNKNERHSLLGPLIVGLMFGALVAVAEVGVGLEYGQFKHQSSALPTFAWVALEATLTFFYAAGGPFVLLGVLPVAVGRWLVRAAARRDA